MTPSSPATTTPATAAAQEPPGGVIISRGTRVSLRTLTPADLGHLAIWVDDPFLDRMVGSDLLQTFRDAWDKSPAFYQALLNDPTQVVLVIVANRDPRRPLGLARLFNIHLLEGYAFLEVIVADPRALRFGFGVEAGKLISYYGVDVLGLRRIEAKVYAYNVLSINSLKRNGFQLEGVLRQAGFDGKNYCDLLVFGILKDEIDAARRRDKVWLPLDHDEGNVSDTA